MLKHAQLTVLCITTTLATAGCGTKHIIHEIDVVRDPDAGLRLDSPADVSKGIMFALPRTVLTVKVPFVQRQSRSSRFWIDFVQAGVGDLIDQWIAAEGGDSEIEPAKKQAAMTRVAVLMMHRAIVVWPGDPQDYLDQLLRALEADGKADVAEHIKVDAAYIAQLLDEVNVSAVRAVREWKRLVVAASVDGAGSDNRLTYLSKLYSGIEQTLLKPNGIRVSGDGPKRFSMSKGGVTFGSALEPDPEHVYFAEVRRQFLQDHSMVLELSEHGVITAGDSHVVDKKLDTFVKVVGTAASIMTGIRFSKAAESEGRFDEEMMYRVLTTARTQIEELIEQREHIQALRSGRGAAWEGNLSEGMLSKALSGARAVERELLNHFTVEVTGEWKPTFEVRPAATTGKIDPDLLFELSPTLGVRGARGLVGRIPAKFNGKPDGTDYVEHVVRWTAPGSSADDVGSSGVPLSYREVASTVAESAAYGDNMGFRYRVPVRAIAELEASGGALAMTELMVAQFGPVLALPSSTGNSDTKFAPSFYPTGGLKKVTIHDKTADVGGAVESVGKSVNDTLEAARNEEVEKLKRRKEMLQLEKDIRELRKEAEGDEAESDGTD